MQVFWPERNGRFAYGGKCGAVVISVFQPSVEWFVQIRTRKYSPRLWVTDRHQGRRRRATNWND